MGKAMEVIAGQATAPGAVLTPLTMNAGNSAQIRNADLASTVALLQTWARNNAAGIWQIRSPKMHDNVHGLRYRIPAASPQPLIVPALWEHLIPQDTLILELSGSAVGGQIEQAAMLHYYNDLPGSAARLITPAELKQRTVNMWTNEIPIAPGVLGGYSGQVAINSVFDQFKANTDYALVGYQVDVACTVVGFTSPDFANLRVGGPGLLTARWLTSRWFIHLSEEHGIPLIPVFNSANKFATLVDVMQDQAGAAVNVTALLHELAMPNGPLAQPALK